MVARLLATPVLVGYLSGYALVIGAGQVSRLLAVHDESRPYWGADVERAVGRR
jgi:MFS superfamily sulfate permease-like transporter